LLGITAPIIMAPMFLVSNVAMVQAAIESGITGAIPALNYRSDGELRNAIAELKEKSEGPFGINLIANKSNFRLKEQLKSCLDLHVDFIITSLGNPNEIIQKCHEKGIKVFCDVVDRAYGSKAADAGPDALIAVNHEAGGHAGKLSSEELFTQLREITDLPVISAGGVGTGRQLHEKLSEGFCGISMGSPFIATDESPVSDDYKMACVNYSSEDIVMTTKLSGTPCTVINTPFVQKSGTRQNFLENMFNRNRRLKKWAKSLTFYKGMKTLQKAAFTNTYQSVWCAGPSIEHVHKVMPVKELLKNLLDEYQQVVSAQVG